MKVIMYSAETCPDCISAKQKLAAANIEPDIRDITKNLKTLKEFLSYRDHDDIFAPVIKAGGIGIPFFILEDQTHTFLVSDFLDAREPGQTGGSCSVDAKTC